MPEALDVDWLAIQLSAVSGVPYPALALEWGMVTLDGKPDTRAIRQRASRENWPVPSAIHKRAKAQHRIALTKQAEARQQLGIKEPVTNVVTPVTMDKKCPVLPEMDKKCPSGGFSSSQSGENATVIVTDNLLDLAKAGSLRFAQVAHRSLQAMPDELLIASPSDAATTVKTLRSIAGLDKDGTTINVAIGGGWSDWPEPVSQERDVTPVSTDLADY